MESMIDVINGRVSVRTYSDQAIENEKKPEDSRSAQFGEQRTLGKVRFAMIDLTDRR